MSLLEAVVLGLLQGLTEFLPVSSDGHLALGGLLLGVSPEASGGIFYDLLLHLATLLAVVVHFRRELWSLRLALGRAPGSDAARRVVLLIVAASIPTAVIGLLLKDAAERAFEVPLLVGIGFLATALVLTVTAVLLKRRPPAPDDGTDWEAVSRIRVRDALLIGALQGLAPWPGFSRSGVTIAGGVAMGVPPVAAARFSLLISLPAIGGAFLLKLREVEAIPSGGPSMAAGFVVAGVVGFLAIGWLIAIARRARLGWFAAYTLVLGLVTVTVALLR